MKTIKKVETKNFEIQLIETDAGYTVLYENAVQGGESENTLDYNTASFLFDLKLQDLEGQ